MGRVNPSRANRRGIEMWILFTVFAAFMQTWRNAFKSKLSATVGVVGTTLARFLYAPPIAGAYLLMLYAVNPIEQATPNGTALPYIAVATVLQIVATALMVQLFKLNNYTIGVGLAKSEALVAALLGVMFFGSSLTLLGWFGVIVGTVAVFVLSLDPSQGRPSLKTLTLGLGSGASFALTSLCVREASLHSGLTFPHSAAWVLFTVITAQATLLVTYLLVADRGTLIDLWHHRKLTLLVSITSCLGSIGWFSAMALEEVPYVKTLGQVEVFFTMMVSYFWLKEGFKKRDSIGLILIAIAAIMVMWP